MLARAQWLSTTLLLTCYSLTAGCSQGDSKASPGDGGTILEGGAADANDGGTACVAPSTLCTGAGCISRDKLTHNSMPRNGLTSKALSAAQPVLQAIQGGSLSATTLTPMAPSIASSADLHSLMNYIASCALDAGATIDLGVRAPDGSPVILKGELGLCGASSSLGNWATGIPSSKCLEMVSACILARVNALNKRVIISVRTKTSGLLPLQPKVPVEEAYRDNVGGQTDGTPIQSFGACASGASPDPTARDCGWQGRYVGSCLPGNAVTVEPKPGMAVRVCRGIYGCDPRDTPPSMVGMAGFSPYATPWYSGVLGSSKIPLTFTCPANGISMTDPSYFSIMVASATDPLATVSGDVTVSGAIEYPSPEENVFRYREGAFFGNIFNPVKDNMMIDQVLVADQYACYSDVWTAADAHLTDRLCAGPGATCFANQPAACLFQHGPPVGIVATPHFCQTETCTSSPVYSECAAPIAAASPPKWEYSITVYLNHLCDLARDLKSCTNSAAVDTTVFQR